MSVFDLLAESIQDALIDRGFDTPTEPQSKAIPLILDGKNVLLIAPTGTGKTEAAFLPVLHFLLGKRSIDTGIKVLYITPLRALNRDILDRLEWWCKRFDLRLAVRHGDTSKRERSFQATSPPDILITTPETFQAILAGRVMSDHLSSVRWVIVDEVHELAGEKRGTQLSLAMERLRYILGRSKCDDDYQIVGLSATIGSPDKVARFLVGVGRRCEIVRVPVARSIELEIRYPKPGREDYELAKKIQTFPEVAARLRYMRELLDEHRSVLLFTNTRSIAEVLSSRFRVWDINMPISIHHGSLSRSSRMDAERGLKESSVRGIVCTSSLELGIDIGALDAVIQYNSPRQVTRLLQRVGRSGHKVGGVAKGVIIAQDADDVLEAMAISRCALVDQMEDVSVPESCYDVLIHQLGGMLMMKSRWDFEESLEIIRRSYPYREITAEQLEKTLVYMRDHRLIWLSLDRFTGGEYFSKPRNKKPLYNYYFENLSMIPDVKQFLVIDNDNGDPVGVLDDEFVAEHGEIGKKFIIRGSVWRIEQVYKDAIYVNPEEDPTGAIPSWVGEEIPVPYAIAQEVGSIRGEVENKLLEGSLLSGIAEELASRYPISVETAKRGIQEIIEQVEGGIPVPTDTRIIIEGWEDYVIIHCAFGLLINRTLSYILGYVFSERIGYTVGVQQDPYRIVLKTKYVTPDEIKETLEELGNTPSKLERTAEEAFVRTGIYKRRVIHVARKCGALSRDFDFTKLDIDIFDDVIKEEAMRTMLLRDVDVDGTKKVLGRMGNIKIEVIDNGGEISPIGRIGMEELQRQSDLIPPERMHRIIVQSVHARLLNESRTFVCTNCWNYIETCRIADIVGLRCKECGSARIGVLDSEEVAMRLCDKARNARMTKEYASVHSEVLKSSELIFRYGKPAVIVLAGRMSISDARKILREEEEENERLIELIINAEKNALKRRFR
jgi:ATP-dependent Lhr-like helicase